MEAKTYRRINLVARLLPPATEIHYDPADLFGVDLHDVTPLRSFPLHDIRRLREERVIVQHAKASALELHHLLELLPCAAISELLKRKLSPGRYVSYHSASFQHQAAELDC